MKKLLILYLLVTFTAGLYAHRLYNLQTRNLNMIYYSNAHSYIVPHLARCYERTWNYYQKVWDYQPSEKSIIFIEDFSDWANGGATAVPHDFVYISMSPYMYVFDVSPANERMSLLMHHELTHVYAMDMASTKDQLWRKVFGSKIQQINDHPVSLLYAWLTSPRKFSPRWYHEGIAVNMETWMSGGIGRAMGAYDEMVFRSMVQADREIYDFIGLEAEGTAIDFQVGANSYLYGTRFFSYLAYKYGPQKLISWVKRNDETKTYFSSNFKFVYNLSLQKAWHNWIDFENEFQNENLSRISQYPLSDFNPILNSTMGSVSKSFFDTDTRTLFTGVKYPGKIPHLIAIDTETGNSRKICNIKGASTYYTTSLAYDKDSSQLFYTSDNFYRRDLNAVDIYSGKSRRLITNLRAGDLAFNNTDKSIWAVRHENGISTLIRIEEPYKDYTAIYAFPYGEDCYDLDISPDGTLLTAAITHINGNQELALFKLHDLLDGITDYISIFDFDYTSPANFVFSNDGRFLYGSAYYTGVSNIYRYDVELKDMSIISNCQTGMFRPVPVNNDSLIAYRYESGNGWVPGWIKNQALDSVSSIRFLGQMVYDKFPQLKNWDDGSPAAIDLDAQTTLKGDYRVLDNILLNGAYPVILGYKDHTALGYRLQWQDALGFLRFNLQAATSVQKEEDDKQQFHASGDIVYKNFTLHGGFNQADFYDLFGPVKTSRKGYSYGIEYNKNLIYDKPRTMDLNISATGYGDLEIMPEFQNVETQYSQMYQSNITIDYSFIQNSLGAVDGEQGFSLSCNLATSLVNDQIYPSLNLAYDQGIALPWHHTSIWIRNSTGYHFNDDTSSFASFYFGGFGNNWIDNKEVKRYREFDSFPGLDINEAGGRRFAKSLLDLNLPPLRFSHTGYSALYARWLRTSLFAGILAADYPDYEMDTFYTAGFQCDIRIISLSLLKTTLSFGGAFAWDKDYNRSNEVMISLKIF